MAPRLGMARLLTPQVRSHDTAGLLSEPRRPDAAGGAEKWQKVAAFRVLERLYTCVHIADEERSRRAEIVRRLPSPIVPAPDRARREGRLPALLTLCFYF